MNTIEVLRVRTSMAHDTELIVAVDLSIMGGKVQIPGIVLASFPTEQQARLVCSAIALSAGAEDTLQELKQVVKKDGKGVLQ